MRNFGNKLWNIGRFIKINIDKFKEQNIKIREFNTKSDRKKLSAENKKILSQLGMLTQGVTREIENYNFAASAERLYKFIWHTFADKYIESVKEKLRQNDDETLSVTIYTYSSCLKLLHPFMPFITEEINFSLTRRDKPLISSHWS